MPHPAFSRSLSVFTVGFALIFVLVLVPATVISGLYLLHVRGELQTQLTQMDALTKQTEVFATDALATEVYASGGEKIGEFASERRFFVPLRELPPVLIKAFLSAEDKDFYHHYGVSPTAIGRALLANLRRGRARQGASTITQQLVRLYFLDQSKTWERKLKEAVLAFAIEHRLVKDSILELYLNKIYLGNGSYGVEAAARNYFRKSARDLNAGEAAMLAGLPKSPSAYAPHKHLAAAARRRRFVLERMAADGVMTKAEAKAWGHQPLHVASQAEDFSTQAPYVTHAVEQELARKLEIGNLGHQGLKIYTTLDARLQKAAAAQLGVALRRAQKEGQAGEANRELQGALVSIDPNTGGILAMQGGRAFDQSQFNRAEATRRPLGALFLPIYIGLALESGYSLTSRIGDDPFGGKHAAANSGALTLYDVLTTGDVTAGAPLYVALGSGSVRAFARRLGLDFQHSDMSLAFGSGEATPTQAAAAYAAIVNGGRLVEPHLIAKVTRADGTVLYRAPGVTTEQALQPKTAEILELGLHDALVQARRAVAPLAGGLGAASDDLHDGWFVGTLPGIVSAVWIGAEHGRTRVAATNAAITAITSGAWTAYMLAAPETYLLSNLARASKRPHPKGASAQDFYRRPRAGRSALR